MSKFCVYCGGKLEEDSKFCISCGAEVASKATEAKKDYAGKEHKGNSTYENAQNNYNQPQARYTNQEKNILKRFWNSEQFGWFVIRFFRISNYISMVFGVLLLFNWNNSLFRTGGVGIIILGVISIIKMKNKQRIKSYTKCTSCQQEVKIGIPCCPTCGASIPVQSIAPETVETAAQEHIDIFGQGSYKQKKRLERLGPLEVLKREFVFLMIIVILVITFISAVISA